MGLDDTMLKLGVALAILFLGFTCSQVITSVLVRLYRGRKRIININADRRLRGTRYVIATISLVAALVYLRIDAVENLLVGTATVLPDLLTAILLIVLGVMVVRFATSVLERVLATIGFMDYATDAYGKQQMIKAVLFGIQLFLYLVVIESTLSLLGVYSRALDAIIRIIVYGSVLLIFVFAFVGLRSMVENAIAGFYLKSNNYVRQGQRLIIDEESGEITHVTAVQTTILTDGGYLMVIPNKELMQHKVKFEKVKPELKTLEEVKNHFVEQRPSFCGPACAQMILSILKCENVHQDEIAKLAGTEVGKGTHPERLKHAIEEVTNGEVIAQWVSVSKIVDLKQELQSWLNDGALIMVDFLKKEVFPTVENEKAHYAVCVGMEGDELIILDPSGPKGGVYLANHQDVHRGMNTYSKLLQNKRGYLVVAKRGTSAYWRIKRGLVYADKDLYGRISGQLEAQFERMVSKSSKLKNVFPDPVRDFLNDQQERYRVARLWRPEK